MNKAVPVLQIDDYQRAKEYYVQKLGFRLDFEYRHEPNFPVFMGVQHGEIYLHLSEHGRGHPGSEVYIFVDDIEEWVRRFKIHGVEVSDGPSQKAWGNTEMAVSDPFRNLLRFTQVDTHSPSHGTG